MLRNFFWRARAVWKLEALQDKQKLVAYAGHIFFREQVEYAKKRQTSTNPKSLHKISAGGQNVKYTPKKKIITKQAVKRKRSPSNGVVKDRSIASMYCGRPQSMIRAFVPDQSTFLGFPKPKANYLFSWLRNCEIAGILTADDHEMILKRFQKVQDGILKMPNAQENLKVLYQRLAMATAFEEKGIKNFLDESM